MFKPCLPLSRRFVMIGVTALLSLADPTNAQEVGPNDFRISAVGPAGNPAHDALHPAAAFNPSSGEYLVVWAADPDASGEYEIYGQRLDACTSASLGLTFRISEMGPDGSSFFDALHPSVAFNALANEYLVVWEGLDSNSEGPEVFGQRLAGATGAEIGTDFAISQMGNPGSGNIFGAFRPEVAYCSTTDTYAVAWVGRDGHTFPLPPEIGDWEIYGQILDGTTASEVGTGDFLISDLAHPNTIGPEFSSTLFIDLAANDTAGEFLVVWDATKSGEYEIYGQLVAAATGTETGLNDFRISDMGTDGQPPVDAAAWGPAVAFSPEADQYLVVWVGDDDATHWVEIYGQCLEANGTETGPNDFRLSDMDFGTPGPVAVALGPDQHEFLVTWGGQEQENQKEVYAQKVGINPCGLVGPDDFRLSDAGPDGSLDYHASSPALVANDKTEYLVVWGGSDDLAGLVPGEIEVFGQRVSAGPTPLLPHVNQLSLTQGGLQSLSLDAGAALAGRGYLVVGSFSGVCPAITVGGLVIPLVYDSYFEHTLMSPGAPPLSGALGVLDSQGQATIQFVVPAGSSPSFAGVTLHHMAAVFDQSSLDVLLVSNPAPVTLTP